MKKAIINRCLLILINILLILSVFLPIINIVTYNPETGSVSKYYSLLNLFDSVFLVTVPYIIFLLTFLVTSIFIHKGRTFRVMNLLFLLLISLVGLTTLIIFFSVASLYGLVYIFSILVIIKIWHDEKIAESNK